MDMLWLKGSVLVVIGWGRTQRRVDRSSHFPLAVGMECPHGGEAQVAKAPHGLIIIWSPTPGWVSPYIRGIVLQIRREPQWEKMSRHEASPCSAGVVCQTGYLCQSGLEWGNERNEEIPQNKFLFDFVTEKCLYIQEWRYGIEFCFFNQPWKWTSISIWDLPVKM